MVNDCWYVVALPLLGPQWRYDDNTAVCWSQFTIACNTFTLPYIYHTTWYIRMMKHVVAPYLMDPLVYIGCPWSRIQTQHDLKSLGLSVSYSSIVTSERISSTTWPGRGMPMSQGNIWNLLPSFPMPARGVAIYNSQSDPCYCSLPLLFYLCLFRFYPAWPVLSDGRISVQPCAVYQLYLGRTRGPPRSTTCLLIHWVK